MLINLLVLIVVFITAFLGGYLVSHRNKTFLSLDPTTDSVVHNVANWGGISLLFIALLGVVSLFLQNSIFIIIVLLIATVVATTIQFILFNHLKIK
ncbi:hypothetical protein FC56_GL000370 [Lentilactobacillus senioris DSM 24302 = JCM 17472]|uniref:DUF3784 domain-containing protein n=1 Tax=Lentilactobacillus senioris DSM 24302 = JCM 17472 TaxID=1423802 RepID=A0A0R2CQP5_9LACO|nr:hypothetical protein [Lentilactobacillus senioris]KRM93653.1 hypothetical protein FC56_GL000370 [Lentilactobacillus senioris DSM 24302 = JCM 17472]